jgi:hypothetical protein
LSGLEREPVPLEGEYAIVASRLRPPTSALTDDVPGAAFTPREM